MKKSIARVSLAIVLFAVPVVAQQSLDAMIDRELAQLVNTYKMLHAAPELSHYEVKTSAFLAQQLRALGYEVTENVGKYDKPEWKGHGVVAVMKNGAGPTVLVRSDMDALPVERQTQLPYASTVKTRTTRDRKSASCTLAVTICTLLPLIGTATMLARLKEQWRGNSGTDRTTGGRDRRWRESDVGRRFVFAYSEARLCDCVA
jgi:hippurate hydrolase